MFLRKVSEAKVRILLKRTFYQSSKVFSEGKYDNPILKRFGVFGTDPLRPKETINKNKKGGLISDIPTYADVVIVGGGVMGSSTAYWLKEKSSQHAFSVAVIERDLTYTTCSTCLSCGGLRQQFSLPENIQMSVYGAEFMKTLKERFGPEADVNFTPNGYLILSSEEGAEQLIANSKLQNELGAVNTVLRKQQIKDRFPWLNVDDIEVGCLGLEKEGWFDPWTLLQLFKNGAAAKNVNYVNANVVDFKFETRSELITEGFKQHHYEHPKQVVIQTPDGEKRTINFALCVLAAGPDSGKVAELLKIGTGSGILSVPLPVERRKRYIYTFTSQDDLPGIKTPKTFDFTGAYFRREGIKGDFIGGLVPKLKDEPETTNLDVDYSFWDNAVWPLLAHRIPAFNAVKVKGGWAGFYEYNRYDENGIIGPHPYYSNIYVATGFSGHGIQQSPAVGRAMAELILDGKFQTIDLSRLGFNRLLEHKPMYESEIY